MWLSNYTRRPNLRRRSVKIRQVVAAARGLQTELNELNKEFSAILKPHMLPEQKNH